MSETAKKSSIWGALKSLAVEEVPDAPTPPPRNTPVPSAPRNTPLPPPPFYGTPAPGGVVQADPEVLAKLEKRLQNNCPPEYLAVMEQYNLLKEDVPDERQRFKVALKTTHTTSAQVLAALDQMSKTMDGAREEFHRTFDENKTRKTVEAESSIKATQDLIAANEEQIRTIQNNIIGLREKLRTSTENLHFETQRLENIAASFEAAWVQVYTGLQTQKNRIDSMPKV